MSLDHRPLQELDQNDLENLRANKVPEGKRIEYKSGQPATTNEKKKKFLAQVSSFANASGGYLIYGILEKGGVPTEIQGFDIDDTDVLTQQLQNLIRDGTEPRIWGLEMYGVPLKTGKKVLVIKIPRSFNPPHMVLLGDLRFYSRGLAGKYPLDVNELRILFGLAQTTAARIRAFRLERLAHIKNSEAPVQLLKGPKYVLHLVPFDSLNSPTSYDLSVFEKKPGALPNIRWAVHQSRYNFEGFVSHYGHLNSDAPTAHPAYTQCFRNGIIEAVYMQYSPALRDAVQKYISIDYETHAVQAVGTFLEIQQNMGVAPPIVLMLSVLGVKGLPMSTDGRPDVVIPEGVPFDRDDLVLPNVTIENYDCDVHKILVPVFDIVLNSASIKRPT